jgi:anthranilate phosphoribosyltransferase
MTPDRPQTPRPEPQDFLRRLINNDNLSRPDATRLLDWLLDGTATDAQIAATLIALKQKGETIEELAGLAQGMRERATHITCSHSVFIDTAGTGSSCAKTFNVSTAAAFVTAGAGLPVAKHGNRAASSRCGSADVLSALGVNVAASPAISEKCLNEFNICFMFAPLYHQAAARVAAVRRELGVQTTFNLLGPLTNPAGAPRQIIGISNRSMLETLARTLVQLGTETAWVVHGEDGLDEVTIAGETLVAEATNSEVRQFQIQPEDFGLARASLDNLTTGDAEANARVIREVLSGERHDAARALVVINAATALKVGGLATDLKDARDLAERSIDSGAARQKLDGLIRLTSDVN